jgi:hypothetical protein
MRNSLLLYLLYCIKQHHIIAIASFFSLKLKPRCFLSTNVWGEGSKLLDWFTVTVDGKSTTLIRSYTTRKPPDPGIFILSAISSPS